MKRKILALLAVVTLGIGCVAGCNKQVVDLNLRFDRAKIQVGEEWVDVKIKSWTDYEDGEQFQLSACRKLYLI